MSSKTLTIILLVAQCVLAAAFLIRSDKRLSDFPAFYSVVRLWQKGEQPYSLENQCREQRRFQRSECLPFAHPPILLQIQSLLTTDNYVASYWRWAALLIAVMMLCLIPLVHVVQDTSTAAMAVLWQPVVASVWIGQDTPLVVAAILFWWWLLQSGRSFLSGLALSVAVIKPHFALALALPLLFVNRRAFAGFCVGAFVLTLYSFALIGADGFRGIIHIVSVMAQGKGFGVWAEGYANIAGILARTGISHGWVWMLYPIGIIAITVVWHRFGLTIKTLSIALVVMLLTAPHVHPWDIAPLLLPLATLGTMPLLLSSALLFALWPYRLLHLGCYFIFAGVLLSLHQLRLNTRYGGTAAS